MDLSRTILLIGEENLSKLQNKHVTVVGVGGVGGYVATMLARAGIGNLRIIDFDVVSPSNVNRQITAYKSTIGRKKVEVLKDMLLDINDKLIVEVCDRRLTSENICGLIGETNIVVDAIDSVSDKISLILYCKQNAIPIISSMGAGNRSDLPNFVLTDIYKTSKDGLAKKVRQQLRKNGVESLEVVTSTSNAQKVGKTIASISYYPASCGCYIASVVVNKIIKGEI